MAVPRPTLAQVFALTMLGLAGLLALLFTVFFEGSRRAVIEAADGMREAAARRVEERVRAHLDTAEQAVEALEREVRAGAVDPADDRAVERALFAAMLNTPSLAELTLTRARRTGFAPDGAIAIAPDGRTQVSVYRVLEGDAGRLVTRITSPRGGQWQVAVRDRPPSAALDEVPLRPTAGAAGDPTAHLTFLTPASRDLSGRMVWSDLHWSEGDPSRRRVVATVMKAIEGADGAFVGVVRAGLLTEQLDEVARIAVTDAADDPHRILLADEQGRLITRLSSGEPVREEADNSLRVEPAHMPAEVAAALGDPALRADGEGPVSRAIAVDGRRFLVTALGLARTQGWRTIVLAPEDFYMRGLARRRTRVLAASLAVIALILVGGLVTLMGVRRGLGHIVTATERIAAFDFAASVPRSPFRDVHTVLQRLELAKTAMRAMGRYVPVDLVRLLYQTGREPALGGEVADVTLMFTDIKDFTTLSESLPPNELARVLGRYLDVMTTAIHSARGTIDKYIGDAIMALWNTPTPCDDHPRRACEAALACLEAEKVLFASPEWEGRPPLLTRFGIHRDRVMVGHFGAPDRMSFTCLGDGVNVAARLEGLNKQYGTRVLVSESVREAAGDGFEFRLVDVVAVKGRTRGVKVYELRGRAGAVADGAAARDYERALEKYWARDFDGAVALLDGIGLGDGPSRVLRERARTLARNPPPADWDGVYVAQSK
jgi:adenylate cyclase